MSTQIILDNRRWSAGTPFIVGQQIFDNTTSTIQQCTTAGTSGGSTPAFSSTVGHTTSDGATLIWTCTSPSSAPIWIVPPGGSITNSIETIGGGGAGGSGGGGLGSGGGGGGYSKITNLLLTAGAMIPYSIGAGGPAGTATDGGDTWFNGSSLGASSVGSKGGKKGAFTSSSPGTIAGGLGGAASSGVGVTKFSGGNGGSVTTTEAFCFSGAGGGGAAGPHGNGGNGGVINVGTTGTNLQYGSGGGGNSGGSAGQAPTTGSNVCELGGNNFSGSGGGPCTGSANSSGGGGQGQGQFSSFGVQDGTTGTEFGASSGTGGGGGGSYTTAGNGAPYGGGGGGSGGHSGGFSGGGGGGAIVLTLTPYVPPPVGTVGAVWVD